MMDNYGGCNVNNIDRVTSYAVTRKSIVVVDQSVGLVKERLVEIYRSIARKMDACVDSADSMDSMDSSTLISGVPVCCIDRIRGANPTLVWICCPISHEDRENIRAIAPEALLIG